MKLKIGDKVRMVICLEADRYTDYNWLVKSNPWMQCGTEVIMLEGFKSSFATEFLELVDQTASTSKAPKERKNYENENCFWNGQNRFKLKILKWLAILSILILLLGINERHQIDKQKQIDTIKHQQLIRQMQRLEIENRQLKFEVVKARQVRAVMRRYGCYDHRIFKACMDQPYLKPVEAAIFIAIESEFNPNATSRCGAKGSMQIMDCWGLKNPYDIKTNIEFGCRLYRRYLDKYKTWDLAISAFNAGEGAVRDWGGVPPYEETLAYIAVFKRMNRIYNPITSSAV